MLWGMSSCTGDIFQTGGKAGEHTTTMPGNLPGKYKWLRKAVAIALHLQHKDRSGTLFDAAALASAINGAIDVKSHNDITLLTTLPHLMVCLV